MSFVLMRLPFCTWPKHNHKQPWLYRRGARWQIFLMGPRAMNPPRAFALCLTIVIMALAGGAVAASAQSYPSRPVRLLLGLPPGGAADVTARLLARGLEGKLGQPVVVENKPGGGGNLVGQLVAN